MSIFGLLQASMEDEGEGSIIARKIRDNAVENISLSETERDANEMEAAGEIVSAADTIVEGVRDKAIEIADEKGELSQEAYAMLAAVVAPLCSNYGIKDGLAHSGVSVESFSIYGSKEATVLSLEGIKETAIAAWKKFKAFVIRVWKGITDFIKKLFEQKKRTLDILNDTKRVIKATPKRVVKESELSVMMEYLVGINVVYAHKYDVDNVLRAFEKQIAKTESVLSVFSDLNGSLAKVVEGYVRDDKKDRDIAPVKAGVMKAIQAASSTGWGDNSLIGGVWYTPDKKIIADGNSAHGPSLGTVLGKLVEHEKPTNENLDKVREGIDKEATIELSELESFYMKISSAYADLNQYTELYHKEMKTFVNEIEKRKESPTQGTTEGMDMRYLFAVSMAISPSKTTGGMMKKLTTAIEAFAKVVDKATDK